MKKNIQLLFLLVLGCFVNYEISAQVEQGALDATEAFFTAKMCDDYETLISLIMPDLIEQAGGRERMRATLSKIQENQISKGIFLQEYKIKQEFEQTKTKSETHVLVPFMTISKVPGGTLTNEGHLIAVGTDNNTKWYIVETSSLNEYNIQKVVANWDNSILLPFKKSPVFKEDK